MAKMQNALAIAVAEAPLRVKPSAYPPVFAARVAGREKRPLGDLFGLTNFGVNLATLPPGTISALRHAHGKQDEFIYVVSGYPTLVTDEGKTQLSPGMCAGFKSGSGNAHQLLNETQEDVTYLEVGDRTAGDTVEYPDDDLKGIFVDGAWQFTHKDGQSY
jgi:uncharacterized cupin superfamily protein